MCLFLQQSVHVLRHRLAVFCSRLGPVIRLQSRVDVATELSLHFIYDLLNRRSVGRMTFVEITCTCRCRMDVLFHLHSS